MEKIYPMKEGYFPESNGNPDDAAPAFAATPVQNQNYLNTILHKGIFQPPNQILSFANLVVVVNILVYLYFYMVVFLELYVLL